MSYPVLRSDLHQEEVHEHFSLSPTDLELVRRARTDAARLGCAVLLVGLRFLGYPPRRTDVPPHIVAYVARQLGVAPELLRRYRWKGRMWDRHLAMLRQHLGCRHLEAGDRQRLQEWVKQQVRHLWTRRELMVAAVRRLRELGLELPREAQLRRLIHSARRTFLQELYATVAGRIKPEALERATQCLNSTDTGTSEFDWLKSPPGKAGKKTLLAESNKLATLRMFNLDYQRVFAGVPERLVRAFRNRARAETAAQMRRHPAARQATLLAAFLCTRQAEVTDQVVQIFLELVRKAQKKGQAATEKEMASALPRVLRKGRLLRKVVRAASEQPEAAIGARLVEVLGEDVFRALLEEEEGPSYEVTRARHTQKRVSCYRSAIETVLETLDFQASNPRQQPLLEGLELVKRHLKSRRSHYPAQEELPHDLLTGSWPETVLEEGTQGERACKAAFELCVLSKLEKALKCKEVWVPGAYRFRNPDEDLPGEWPERRRDYYEQRSLPVEPSAFLQPLQREMLSALQEFHDSLGRADQPVTIRHPGGGARGIFKVPRPEKQPERPILETIKDRVIGRWGILDLLDILVEADRQVDLIRYFPTSAQRQVLGQAEVRRRLLLVLFGLGTNMGLKRIHSAAAPDCSYDDLRYFLRRFVSAEGLREANAALVNRILAVRNPAIWGAGTTCASDGKHLGAWERNPVTEWHPHYDTRGVMVYWHVQTNATCIYSQLKKVSASQVASMIEGLVRHDTEMRIESNCVDSHGQSEVAFAFCRMLGFKLLPRLKLIKDQRLCLPEKGMAAQFPGLSGVLAARDAINWSLIQEQYDEMVRHVVAVAEGTGPTESILRRFHKNNRSHPVYKAFIELGKAEKTRFLCQYLTAPKLRQEIHEALNVIENWNSCVEFICFGRKVELQTNDPEMQELTVLAIHLLQNALVLANTVMVERVLAEGLLEQMVAEDFRALTPLFTSNVNPYGDFQLNLEKPSFLEVA